MKTLRRVLSAVLAVTFLILFALLVRWSYQKISEYRVLKAVVERLSADSRAAEVLVTQSRFNEKTRRIETTIKFLEYDARGEVMPARYFTFQGNIIQFQSLVIRFEDRLVKAGDRLRGKSAYLFMKVFVLDGEKTQVFDITPASSIPNGYKVPGLQNAFEGKLWEEFWSYALDPEKRSERGVKNAQIEAPGSMFLPGTIYTLRLEHDGGIRIDTKPIPEILRDELRAAG